MLVSKDGFRKFCRQTKILLPTPLFLLRLPSARLFSCRPRSPPAGSRSPSSKRPWRRSGTRAPPRCPSSSGSHRKRSEGKRRPPIQMERALAGACRDTRHFDPCHCVRLRCIAPMFFLAGCDPADYSCRVLLRQSSFRVWENARVRFDRPPRLVKITCGAILCGAPLLTFVFESLSRGRSMESDLVSIDARVQSRMACRPSEAEVCAR